MPNAPPPTLALTRRRTGRLTGAILDRDDVGPGLNQPLLQEEPSDAAPDNATRRDVNVAELGAPVSLTAAFNTYCREATAAEIAEESFKTGKTVTSIVFERKLLGG